MRSTLLRRCRAAFSGGLIALAWIAAPAGAQAPSQWQDPSFQAWDGREVAAGAQQVVRDPITGGYIVGYSVPHGDGTSTLQLTALHEDGSPVPFPDRFPHGGRAGLRGNGDDHFLAHPDGSTYWADEDAVNGFVRVAKLRPDGEVDTAFAQASARFALPGPGTSANDRVIGLRALPDGDVVIAAQLDPGSGGDALIRVARIEADGTETPGFGDADGTVTFDAPGIASFAADVEVTPSRIYVLGTQTEDVLPSTLKAVLVSLDAATGAPDVAFDADGVLLPAVGGARTRGIDLAVRQSATTELFVLAEDDLTRGRYIGRYDAATGAASEMGPSSQGVGPGPWDVITAAPGGDLYVAGARATGAGTSELAVDSLAPGGPDPLSKTYGLDGGVPLGCTSPAGAPPVARDILHSPDGDRVVVAGTCPPSSSARLFRATGRPRFGAAGGSATPPTTAPSRQRIVLDDLPFRTPLGAESGTTIQAAPWRSSPLLSSPFRSAPWRSSPWRSSPWRSSPWRSSALPPILLSQVPLIGTTWEEVLKGTSLEGAPPNTLTVQQVFALSPEPPALAGLTLDEIDLSRTPLAGVPVAAALLGQVLLRDLPPPHGGWCDYVAGQRYDCTDGASADVDTLVSLALKGDDLDPYLARPLPLKGAGIDLTTSSLFQFRLVDIELKATPIGALPSSALGALLTCNPNCAPTVAGAQAADPEGFTDASVLELVRDVPEAASLTLGDLLPGLLAPADLPIEEASSQDLLAQAPITDDGAVTFEHSVQLDCSLADDLRLEVTLPAGSRRLPGSATATITGFAGGPIALRDHPDSTHELAVFTSTETEGTLTELCTSVEDSPGAQGLHTLSVAVRAQPPARLGSTAAGSRTLSRYTANTAAGGAVDVTDADDPGPDMATAAPLDRTEVVAGYIAAAGDVDAYRIPAPEAGSRISVQLTNLPGDYDLSVTGPPVDGDVAPWRSSPWRSSPFRSGATALLDDGAEPVVDGDSAPPEGLQDAPWRSSPWRSSPWRSSSLNRALSAESASFTVTEADEGSEFLIRVNGFNGANSRDPYLLRYEVTPPRPAPACTAPRSLPSAPRGRFPSLPLPATTRTLVLVNERRLAQLYPNSDIPALRAALDSYAARPDVGGIVVPVESDPRQDTDAAYAAWDANPCSVAAANDVVDAIERVVDGVAPGLRDLRHIVLVGGDTVLPHQRVADLVSLANQSTYADSLVFGNRENAQSAAARKGMVFSDDRYGDVDPQAWTSGRLYVPDVALGRLVETPGEIVAQLQQYAAAGGRLNPTSSFVAGYDFLLDGARAVTTGLGTRFGGAPVTRIDDTWTGADVRAEMTRPGPTATSVNAHYDHYRALPAAAFAGGVPDVLRAGQVGPAPGSILWTMGCNAGASVVDVGAPAADATESARLFDWPQLMGRQKAVYVANTGYGYGDTESVAFSERLMSLYAAQVGSARATAAQALMFAKQQYATEPAPLGVYDAKTLQESVFYGPPTYRVGAAGVEAPTALPDDPAPGGARAATAVTIAPDHVQHTTARGTFWTVGTEVPQSSHGRPLQPRTQRDVTAGDGRLVHGVLLEELEMDVIGDVNPVISRPTIDFAASEPEQDARGGVFPAALARVDRRATVDGRRDVLTLVTGQFESAGDGRGNQRLYRRIAAQVYRSGSADWDPPMMGDIDGELAGGRATFTAHTDDTDVTRAVVLYRDDAEPSVWKRGELVAAGGGRWSGSGPVANGATRADAFVVQMLDGAGNVGFTANKGPGYLAEGIAEPPGGAPELILSPERPASGYHRGPVTVTVEPHGSSSATFQVTIDQAPPFTYSEPFAIAAEGPHTITVVGSDGSRASRTIFIDSIAPTVAGTVHGERSPEGWYGTPVTITWSCEDGGSLIDTCPAPTAVATAGADQRITSPPASDHAGNTATGEVRLSVDLGDPSARIDPGLLGDLILAIGPDARVTGRAADALSGVRRVRVTYVRQPGGPGETADATLSCDASRRACTWSAPAPARMGLYRASAVATDRAGRSHPIARTLYVLVIR